jgi:hypothetical protein
MWSKEHRKLSRRGWSENQIQAHFKEREIIEYQRYNQSTGKANYVKKIFFSLSVILDMQMDSPDSTNIIIT